MVPILNWIELARLVERFRPEIAGLFVDKVVVPARPRFPDGYVRGEWAIRFTARRHERTLIFGTRPRQPYLALCAHKGPATAAQATRSPFDLALGKQLRGAKLETIEALPRERIAVLWFSSGGEKFGLVLVMIPAAPEALLVRPGEQGWPILASTRMKSEDAAEKGVFTPPDGAKAPPALAVREELVGNAWAYYETIDRELAKEAFEVRLRGAERGLKDVVKQATDRIRQAEVGLREAAAEADWQRYGDLLKSSLGSPPPLGKDKTRVVTDFETGAELAIPCDPKLSPSDQVAKFYQSAKRRARRIKESELRLGSFREALARAKGLLDVPPATGDWAALETLEAAAGTGGVAPTEKKASKGAWLGRAHVSVEGLPIWIGRSRDENLELTFKRARGNDVWLHLRGRPGAHVLVPLPSGKKSASLETLLDAAHLAIFYSGGEGWGKTEVDYTFKKHVKRIRDSTEASYTHNKTLIIEIDPARLKRLLG